VHVIETTYADGFATLTLADADAKEAATEWARFRVKLSLDTALTSVAKLQVEALLRLQMLIAAEIATIKQPVGRVL
jgi:hypothetical protein